MFGKESQDYHWEDDMPDKMSEMAIEKMPEPSKVYYKDKVEDDFDFEVKQSSIYTQSPSYAGFSVSGTSFTPTPGYIKDIGADLKKINEKLDRIEKLFRNLTKKELEDLNKLLESM